MGVEQIHQLASELYSLRQTKKQTEDNLKDINAAIKNIEEHKLNDALMEEGINKISLDDMDISKSLVYRGAYTKHTRRDAFKFLFDSQNDGALKQIVSIDLTACPRACFVLDENDIPYTVEYSIHHATLSSILKEMAEAGQLSTEDIDKYSIYIQPQIKVKQKD